MTQLLQVTTDLSSALVWMEQGGLVPLLLCASSSFVIQVQVLLDELQEVGLKKGEFSETLVAKMSQDPQPHLGGVFGKEDFGHLTVIHLNGTSPSEYRHPSCWHTKGHLWIEVCLNHYR